MLLLLLSRKTIIQKNICTSMFIAALFTEAKTWKQRKCPLTGIILTRGGEMVCRSKTWLLAPAWGYWASALSGWASQIPIHLT